MRPSNTKISLTELLKYHLFILFSSYIPHWNNDSSHINMLMEIPKIFELEFEPSFKLVSIYILSLNIKLKIKK